MPIQKSSTMPLPRGWKDHIKSAVLQVISLANYAVAQARGRALNGKNAKARQAAEIDRLRQEVSLLGHCDSSLIVAIVTPQLA